MVGQGVGYGILPEQVVRHLAKALGLAVVRLAEPWAKRSHAVCVRAREEMALPAVRLIEYLAAGGAAGTPGRGSRKIVISQK